MDRVKIVIQAVGNFFRTIGRALKRVIIIFVTFIVEVVNWFKGLKLNPEEDTPFIIDAEKMQALFADAPKINVGIFEGVYNEESNTITHHRVIESQEMDAATRNVLNQAKDGLVVLS